MVSETYKVGKLITDFEKANPDAKEIPRDLKQKFHEAWASDKVNNRKRVDYIWKGDPYYSEPRGGGEFKSTNRKLKNARNSKRRVGNEFTLDDYINHPRYADDPALATAMHQYWDEQLKRQFRFNSKTNHLDHIVPVSGETPGLEHARSKMLLGGSDNLLKSDKMPSDDALAYMQIGKTKHEMIDSTASSPWPRQTPRDKRLIIQNDLGIEFQKGMGLRLPKLQDALASSVNRAGEKIVRNLVPGVGTAMDIQDTKQRFEEFVAEPNLINGAQSVTQTVSSAANMVSDGLLATGLGAPAAAIPEKVSGLMSIADAGLQGFEDYFKDPSSPQ